MRRLLLLCFFLGNVGQALAESDDTWLLLQKASQAARELSYQGVFVYQSGSSAKSVQITHMNFGQGEYARMVVLDGQPREVLSQGPDVVIFSPHNEKVVIEKRHRQSMFPALLPANMDNIKLSYLAKAGGIERVGGRDGQVVILSPKDQLRYAYKLWTDREYGILLKAATLNEKNEVLEQIGFNQLTLLNSQKLDWFQPSVEYNKSYVVEDSMPAKTVNDVPDWLVSEIPQGYHKVDEVMRTVPGKQNPVTQLIYSDGLASVSLFIEPLLKGAAPRTGHTSMGATNFFALVADGHQVMAVGEVPEATVSQFASAVSFKK